MWTRRFGQRRWPVRTALLVAGGLTVASALRLTGADVPTALLAAAVAAGAVNGLIVLRSPALSRPSRSPVPARRRDLVGIVGAVLPAFTAWVVANSVLNPSIQTAVNGPSATSGYSPLLTGELLVGLPLAAVPLLRVGGRTPGRVALPLVLCGLGVVKLTLALLLLKVPAFDAGSVFLAAYGDAVPHATDYPFDRAFADFYFGMYPNNLELAWLFSLVFRVVALTGASGFATYAAVAVALNCAALTATELLTFRVVRRAWGTRAAWAALAALAVFTTLSPWVNTPYSDTLGSLFPIGILALWSRLRGTRTRRALLGTAAALGAVVSVGVAVKPTVLFALIAVVFVDVLRHRRALARRVVRRATTAVVATGLSTGIVVALGSTALIGVSGLTRFDVWTNRQAFPLTHFMKMGSTGNGGFNGDDYADTSRTPPDQRTIESLRVYVQRVRAMGPEGYALFLGQKAMWTFGDGSFAEGAEGDPFPAYVFNDPGSYLFREWFTRGGPHHVSLASFWQACWLLLLAVSAIPAGRFLAGARRRNLDSARIAILLLLGFLMLFETRSRYVYLDVPLVVVAAVGAASGLPALLANLRAVPLLRALTAASATRLEIR